MSTRFHGVYTIMPTPFTDNGALDLPSLERLTDFLINLGVDGLVVLGVMGETPKLSEYEQTEVITTTVKAADGRVPIFSGSGAAGTDLAVKKSLQAMSLGTYGLLVAPPPVQNDEVIFDYYKRINDEVGGLIILHDYPEATGIRLAPELIARLYDALEHVQVIKLEEAPSAPKVSALRSLGSGISIVGGLGAMFFLEELERGADGMMTGFFYPEVLGFIYRAYTQGRKKDATRLFYQACPILRYEFQPGIGLALRKEVYRQRGAITSAFVRHPGAQIDATLRRELEQVLAHCNLEGVRA